jgi:endoglucanase
VSLTVAAAIPRLLTRFLTLVILPLTSFVVVFVILATTGCAPSASTARVEAFKTGAATTRARPDLRRGMNFGDAMEAPNEGEWGYAMSASDFDTVKAAGFDHVRVPMRVNAHAAGRPPFAIQPRFQTRMDWVIDQALSRDLAVIIDLHHYVELMKSPSSQADRLVGIWRQIATRYRGLPPAVVYEILNEPTDNLTAEVWNPILQGAVRAIREIDPERILIIEGAHWGSAKDLRDTLWVPEGDRHIIGSFHMYAPMYFTHQGFGWMPSHFATRGVTFPGPPPRPVRAVPAAQAFAESRDFFDRYNVEPAATNPGGPAAVIEVMEIARAFKERTNLPVYLGEFGAGINADVASRAAWTKVARTEAEKRGFGWGYWDFCHNFAAYSRTLFGGAWIPEIKAALLD